ncbi:hypothetical protein PHMEG_00013904 [Phytophthora megakarya]|uniref:Aspartic protease n=1 Tax=Phytophthora megakarya TaxID=4795 RepID=A0A225W6N8_9STRA|nr:hypothetical protein PHMEG_00013904 [Phytophthora megakarya]
MISLDLARKLKLKLNRQNQVKVSGSQEITASAAVKITLGSRVVYIMEWVANIGEGLDVLLGMDFMFRAGSVDLPVMSPENLYLMPGEYAVVRIQYRHTNPEREVVWAGRGDRWVAKIVYQARSWPVAIKVVNVSKHSVWIDMTPLARIVQPGASSALERELIVNGSPDPRARPVGTRQTQGREKRTGTARPRTPVCAKDGIPMVNQDHTEASTRSEWLSYKTPPCFKVLDRGELVDMGTQTKEDSLVTTRMDVATQVSESQLDSPGCDPGDGDTLEEDRGDISVDTPPEWTTEFEEPQGSVTLAEIHPEQDTSGFPPGPASCTPLEKLEMEYERCMRVSAEDLDLEPGVYIHEGSKMLAQLRDQLVMLPGLSEMHPGSGRCGSFR